jgi:hypothetical protein
MFKFVLAILCIFFSISARACDPGTAKALAEFWTGFRQTSLGSDVKAVSQYYSFPLKISGPFDNDKPIHLSNKMFIEEYDTFFRKGFYGDAKTTLLKNLESKPGDYWQKEIAHAISPNPKLCEARIDDYELAWTRAAGWKISLVYFNDEFSPLKKYLKQRSK